jgi:hypothetical protein
LSKALAYWVKPNKQIHEFSTVFFEAPFGDKLYTRLKADNTSKMQYLGLELKTTSNNISCA